MKSLYRGIFSLRNEINQIQLSVTIESAIQISGYFFRNFFALRERIFISDQKYTPYFSLGNVTRGSLGLSSSTDDTHETHKLRCWVTIAYSRRAHGIEMKRYESRGNCLETGYVLLNNSALPSVDPRPLRHPMVLSPSSISGVSGKMPGGKPPLCP